MKEKIGDIGIIGTGHMGRALIKGLKKIPLKKNIFVIDKNKELCKDVSVEFKVKKAGCLKDLIEKVNILIICVKPQDIDTLLGNMAVFKLRGKLVISILAGITTSRILKKLKSEIAVIRVMPNINALVQMSVNAICGGKYAKKGDLVCADRIFAALGQNFVVSEKKMDIVTAVSGSGPAYTALFVDVISRAAKKNGLNFIEAEKMVMQTLEGTLKMFKERKIAPENFIKKVKSKGGTTEAAFRVFKKNGFEDIILKAVEAAKKRSLELGEN